MFEFQLFFKHGVQHITDLHNYHHIIFLVALFVSFSFRLWGRQLLLITAFTLGHCLSLLLLIHPSLRLTSLIIDLSIPALILIASILNLPQKSDKLSPRSYILKYLTAILFGLFHGAGFCDELKTITDSGGRLLFPLISYNLGIEIGQVFIILVFSVVSILAVELFRIKRREWVLVLSGFTAGAASIQLIFILDQ